MQLHTLKRKTSLKTSQRVGRGGKRGKTAGRGTKGQNARSGRKKRPEERDIIKKLPKLRGYFNTSIQAKAIAIPVSKLVNLPKGEVTVKTLVAHNIVSKSGSKFPYVKVLGTAEVTNALLLKGIEASESAKKAIEKAGGSVKE